MTERSERATLLARCTFPPAGTPVTCAVSGGADSLALLVLAVGAGCQVTAVHVDHGLRPGSAAEADVVQDAAARLGAGFRAESVDVTPGPNLEARARAARYAVLPAGVLTGHTADDQAETVLLNLLRGAGLDGLGGMRPEGHPILALRRHETKAVCAAEGLTPVADPTNVDPAHRRNRVRHELLPLLNDIAQRDMVPILARQAALLRDEADALDIGLDPTDALVMAHSAPALARRAIRAWLTEGQDHPPDAATVERVLAVARREAKATDVGAGRRVARTRNVLRLEH
ncbi:MAG TPA: tRNA lysidine(34) synthetase TilS [Acidimicrobiales bacterium]|nr:tRNA lysidine(34) synthetase TilS [Acidimicrobiales bacterium]